MSELDLDDLYVMRYICGTKDRRLRKLFIKEDDPSRLLLEKIANRYEVQEVKSNSVRKKDENVSKLRTIQYHTPEQTFVPKSRADLNGRCSSCGLQNGKSAECKFRSWVLDKQNIMEWDWRDLNVVLI